MNKTSICHTSIILHPQSPLISLADFTADMGIDDPVLKLLVIDPLPSKFFTGIVWGNIGCDDINVNIKFTTN